MKSTILLVLTVLSIFCDRAVAQNVFDPNEVNVQYNGSNAPNRVTNTMLKWVKGTKVGFNTDRYKSYYFNNMAFRLRYPNGYVADDTSKKYPVILFLHGGGEIDQITSNDLNLFVGAEFFEQKIDSGLFNAFLLFPQSEVFGWDGYYPTINNVLDSMAKYCHTDPDRQITMGISMGGLSAIQYSAQYPRRSAIAIGSSPALIQVLKVKVPEFLTVPVWIGSGTLDGNPSVEAIKEFTNAFIDQGGFVRYNNFPVGHESWYLQWAAQPLVTNWKNAHKANPLVYHERTRVAEGSAVNVRIGLTPGFYAYEWQIGDSTIQNATGSEITATALGSYRARFMRTSTSEWSEWSPVPAVITGTDRDTLAPSKPENLFAGEPGANTLELDWENSTDDIGIANYEIYENDVKKYSSATSGIKISELTANTSYTYSVRAVDPSGNSSALSNVITVKTRAVQATGGLKYKYYEGVWNELPDFAQLYPLKTGFSGNVDVSPKTAENYYSFVWEGYLKVPRTGNYTFEIISDDGSKMYFNGFYVSSDRALVTNDRIHNGPESVSADMAINAGVYPVAFTFFTKEGPGTMEVYWSGPGIPRQIIPVSSFSSTLQPEPDVTNSGLNYKYYEGNWDALPDFNALRPVKTGTASTIDLGIRSVEDRFGIVWNGFINIPVAGNYSFELVSDDGSSFYWNSFYDPAAKAFINNDGLHCGCDAVAGTIPNLAVGSYPFSLAYFEKDGDQNIALYWTGPGLPRQLVPASAFSTTEIKTERVVASPSQVLVSGDAAETKRLKAATAYPNPFTNNFTVEVFNTNPDSKVEVQVFDLNGRLVSSKYFAGLPAGNNVLKMDLRDKLVLKGIYTVRVNVNGVQGKPIRMMHSLK